MRSILSAFAVLVCGILAVPASASHVACGDVLTADTRLDSDITDCPAGLTIGAPGVTLDLRGHTIDGTGEPDAAGVYSAFPGTTVRHGTVTDYDPAVRLEGDDAIVRHMALFGGVRFLGDGFTLAHSWLAAAERAVGGAGSGAAIHHNRVEMAGGVCEGMRLLMSDSQVTHNVLNGPGCEGSALTVTGERNVVRKNAVSGFGQM